MNATEMKATRLATIHKDLMKVVTAISNAARDVKAARLTIKLASEQHHTAENDKLADRLDRMTLNTSDMGFGLRGSIRTALDAYSFQRDRCKRNRAQFIDQGAVVASLTLDGMFQELIALRKAAKAAVVATAEEVAPAAPAAGQETPALDLVLVQVNGLKGLNRVRGMGWVPVKLEDAKGYDSADDIPHLAASLSESLGYPVELQHRRHAIDKRNKALLTIEETMAGIKEQLAELEAWEANATPYQKNEWVMAHGHSPICYQTWFEGSQLCSKPISTLTAPGLCLSVGNALAVQVEAQRGHSVGLRRRMSVVNQDMKTCRDVLAKWAEAQA